MSRAEVSFITLAVLSTLLLLCGCAADSGKLAPDTGPAAQPEQLPALSELDAIHCAQALLQGQLDLLTPLRWQRATAQGSAIAFTPYPSTYGYALYVVQPP